MHSLNVHQKLLYTCRFDCLSDAANTPHPMEISTAVSLPPAPATPQPPGAPTRTPDQGLSLSRPAAHAAQQLPKPSISSSSTGHARDQDWPDRTKDMKNSSYRTRDYCKLQDKGFLGQTTFRWDHELSDEELEIYKANRRKRYEEAMLNNQ